MPDKREDGAPPDQQSARDDLRLLATLIERRYGAEKAMLQPLPSESGKRIYRVEHAHGPRWVLRVYETGSSSAAQALATTLLFLEDQAYPAERIVRSLDDHVLVTTDYGRQLLMTTFLEGTATDYSPATLRVLGATLGRLHALQLTAAHPLARSLPLAEMRPANELPWALEQLTSVAVHVPRRLQSWYDKLTAALRSIDLCEDLPRVLIHNDCHPDNTVHTSCRQVLLLDWEGAGLGPAIIDVGFLLASCDTESPWTPPLPPDPARVEAVIAGYGQHHRLASAELDRLPDAIRFRALVYGAVSFANAIASKTQPADNTEQAFASHWWWQRAQAADEIADWARKQFERAR